MEKQKENYKNHRKYPHFPHIGVGGLLIKDNHILLIKRKYEPDAGFWSIPGGHLKLGEKNKIGAEREFFEETGLKVKVNRLAGILDKIIYDEKKKIKYHYILINYYVDLIEDTTNPRPKANDDALEAKFVHIENLSDYKLTDSMIGLLHKLELIHNL
ncbi:MAG: NUDIX hydrolase [Candidatus Lokiarchaeota archaeon]|nr:NUDIX hydrolase [Candidatus Lokiarchaeota archaeon]